MIVGYFYCSLNDALRAILKCPSSLIANNKFHHRIGIFGVRASSRQINNYYCAKRKRKQNNIYDIERPTLACKGKGEEAEGLKEIHVLLRSFFLGASWELSSHHRQSAAWW